MKKQSQFVPGRIAVTPFIKGAYGNNLSIGDDENKAKQTRSIVICYIFEVIRKEIQERRTARINGKKQSQFYTGHTYVNPLTATVYRKLSVRADQKKSQYAIGAESAQTIPIPKE